MGITSDCTSWKLICFTSLLVIRRVFRGIARKTVRYGVFIHYLTIYPCQWGTMPGIEQSDVVRESRLTNNKACYRGHCRDYV